MCSHCRSALRGHGRPLLRRLLPPRPLAVSLVTSAARRTPVCRDPAAGVLLACSGRRGLVSGFPSPVVGVAAFMTGAWASQGKTRDLRSNPPQLRVLSLVAVGLAETRRLIPQHPPSCGSCSSAPSFASGFLPTRPLRGVQLPPAWGSLLPPGPRGTLTPKSLILVCFRFPVFSSIFCWLMLDAPCLAHGLFGAEPRQLVAGCTDPPAGRSRTRPPSCGPATPSRPALRQPRRPSW